MRSMVSALRASIPGAWQALGLRGDAARGAATLFVTVPVFAGWAALPFRPELSARNRARLEPKVRQRTL